MNTNQFKEWLASGTPRTLVMGILNATPDSFSDAGRFGSSAAVLEHARQLIDEGADLLDIGGESTRPGARRVPPDEQIERIMPVISAIRRESDIAISVDTTLREVARAAADGAEIIVNDISAGREDPDLLTFAAARKFPMILMHMQGEPATMQQNPRYANVTCEVAQFLKERAQVAIDVGIERGHILLDPGIGFGKNLDHNLQLLREVAGIVRLGFPVLIGTSRKRFIGTITDVVEPKDRLIGSCVSAAWAVAQGARIVRAHDVAQTIQAVKTIEAIVGLRQVGG